LTEFPDRGQYKDKIVDMKRLTEIERRNKVGEKLTTEDLRFIYEIDHKINGFGLEKDPRIKEIKDKRDSKQDYADIFNCQKDQVEYAFEWITSLTKVCVNGLCLGYIKKLPEGLTILGNFELDKDNKLTELPKNLKISQDLDLSANNLDGAQIKELPEGLEVGGNLYLPRTVEKLPENIKEIVKGKIVRK